MENLNPNNSKISKDMLIKYDDEELAIALLENHKLAEIYLDRFSRQQVIGNIYKGKVENVLPGMQAAFIDIGLSKNSFLYVEDAMPRSYFNDEATNKNIDHILKKNQEILVQITKEPIGTKGARVTTNITLPGRYLVLMPGGDYIAISRRIEDEVESERLKTLTAQFLPEGMGAIIRTVAQGVGQEELENDLKSLSKLWKRIQGKTAKAGSHSLVHRDLDMLQRLMRDTDFNELDKIIFGSSEARMKVEDALGDTLENAKEKIIIQQCDDLFMEYNIYQQVNDALQRKVWLKNGGYIVIDQVEALTIIDVNTGKFVGANNLSETVLKTNMAAVKEISRQLRLRNIGGIVIIDFIDMDCPASKSQLLEFMDEEFKKDRTRITVLGMTQLGLVELTRKKLGHEISYVLEKECPYCKGKGVITSDDTLFLRVKAAVRREAKDTKADTLLVKVNYDLAKHLEECYGRQLKTLSMEVAKKIQLKPVLGCNLHEITVRPLEE